MKNQKIPSYFLIAVSNRENLDLCLNHMMAGFPNSINGAWVFCDVEVGDFVSFLYAAHAYGLYRIRKKVAILNAERAPPWKPLKFRSGRMYYFPFRLLLEPVRDFKESLIRAEFAYVAENLLLRGGYAKTHFQADQTTLQSASQLGRPVGQVPPRSPSLDEYETFTPKFTSDKKRVNMSDTFPFREVILQTLIRKYLSLSDNLSRFLQYMDVMDISPQELEILGEKALPEGHVDILIKERIPIGKAKVVIVEVKVHRAALKDIEQLRQYKDEIGTECVGACLIAEKFSRKVILLKRDIKILKYKLDISKHKTYTFNELLEMLSLEEL